jgi:hypothetical protein
MIATPKTTPITIPEISPIVAAASEPRQPAASGYLRFACTLDPTPLLLHEAKGREIWQVEGGKERFGRARFCGWGIEIRSSIIG